MARQQRSKSWIFRISNPSNNDLPKSWPDVRYLAYQLERGASGTPHLQGYVVFHKQHRFSAVKKLDSGAHWEKRKGTHAEARDYNTKEATRVQGPWISGTPPNPGKRTDLLSVKQDIIDGRFDKYLWDNHYSSMVRHFKAFDRYRLVLSDGTYRPAPLVEVYYGPTGTGKSHDAWAKYPTAHKIEQSNGGNVWFDGYQGQDTIIIDEFYGWISYSKLLQLLDKYPMRVETKGGTVPFLGSKFVITSNTHPRTWYHKLDYEKRLKALERRIDRIVHYISLDDREEEAISLEPDYSTHVSELIR